MATPTSPINSPHIGMARPSELPRSKSSRTKRSNSDQYDASCPRGFFDPHASQPAEPRDMEAAFVPSTLGEHLLETTYLEDVVRPLVRALVRAHMPHGSRDRGESESAQLYADLDKLRYELEQSAQRAKHVERERDDLARRLELAIGPEHGHARESAAAGALRAERERDPRMVLDSAERLQQHAGRAAAGIVSLNQSSGSLKRMRHGELEPPRGGGYQASISSSARSNQAMAVSASHAEASGSASITVTAEGAAASPRNVQHARSAFHTQPAVPEVLSPTTYTSASGRSRPYVDSISEADRGRGFNHPPPRIPPTASHAYEPAEPFHSGYPDERYGRVISSRPNSSRYSNGSIQSPPAPSSQYGASSASERSSVPSISTYSSTPSTNYSSSTPFSMHSYGDQESELDMAERSRKQARVRPSMSSHDSMMHIPPPPSVRTPTGAYMPPTPVLASEQPTYPIRKLASTKNRTCSNCAAPHDAKFRRGPNGPGTLCDRCGSRWKKMKENETVMQTAVKREQQATSVAVSVTAKDGNGSTSPNRSQRSSRPQSPRESLSGGNAVNNEGVDTRPNGREVGGSSASASNHRQGNGMPGHVDLDGEPSSNRTGDDTMDKSDDYRADGRRRSPSSIDQLEED